MCQASGVDLIISRIKQALGCGLESALTRRFHGAASSQIATARRKENVWDRRGSNRFLPITHYIFQGEIVWTA